MPWTLSRPSCFTSELASFPVFHVDTRMAVQALRAQSPAQCLHSPGVYSLICLTIKNIFSFAHFFLSFLRLLIELSKSQENALSLCYSYHFQNNQSWSGVARNVLTFLTAKRDKIYSLPNKQNFPLFEMWLLLNIFTEYKHRTLKDSISWQIMLAIKIVSNLDIKLF